MTTKSNADYVINTLSAQVAPQATDGTVLPFNNGRREEPKENVRYNNYWHPSMTQKLGAFKMYTSNKNQAPLIAKLDTASQETVDSFNQKLVVGKYSAGKGEHLGKHYINSYLRSLTGHESQLYGKCELLEDNELHRDLIIRLMEGGDEAANEILQECRYSWESAEAVVHEYASFEV